MTASDVTGDRLLHCLEEAQQRGFLGPGPLADLVDHSVGFAEVLESLLDGPPPALLDLGSGGGIPGLLLAERWPDTRVTLVEGSVRRAEFLAEAVDRLGWAQAGHVETQPRRAEELGRDAHWREAGSAMVARSFGAPAVTAECAAPLLQVGGWLVVSEPPPGGEPGGSADGSAQRWPEASLALVGLEPVRLLRARGFGYQVLRKVGPTPDRYPRRVGIPAKRPIY